jgi:hypothetical protein
MTPARHSPEELLVHFPSYRFHTRLTGARVTDARMPACGWAGAKAAHRPRTGVPAGARVCRAGTFPITFAWSVTGTVSTANCARRRAVSGYSEFLGGNNQGMERGRSAGLRWVTDLVTALPGSLLEVT